MSSQAVVIEDPSRSTGDYIPRMESITESVLYASAKEKDGQKVWDKKSVEQAVVGVLMAMGDIEAAGKETLLNDSFPQIYNRLAKGSEFVNYKVAFDIVKECEMNIMDER